MKILFISTMASSSWGGSEELWYKSAIHASEKEHEVVVSVYNWQPLNQKILTLIDKGIEVNLRKKIYFGSSTFSRLRGFLIKKIFSAADIIRLSKYHPDVIIISQGTIFECMYPEFMKLSVKAKAKIFVITQANSEYDTLPSNCFETGRELFNKAEHLFFVSKRNLLVAERQLALKLNNASVISNPANLNSYNVSELNVTSKLNMAFVGRLNSTVKGLGVLFEILSSDHWKNREWSLNLYGKGEDEEYLRKLSVYYNLTRRIVFRGFVNNVNEIWKENHVLLMPSTLEGTPLTLIEAMLCGRTAVVSDVGGNAELIIDGENGFVAEAPSVFSFGNAMERLWIKKDDLAFLSEKARKRITDIIDLHPEKTLIKKIEDIIKND